MNAKKESKMRAGLNVVLVLAALLAFTGAVGAKGLEAKIDQHFKACEESQSTLAFNNCLSKQYALADAELNRVWQQVKTMIEKKL